MTAIAKPATLLTLVCAILSGQTVPAPPRFEVASIKPVDRPNLPKSMNLRSGSFHATNYSLKNLIQIGWDVRDFQVLGGPGWLDSDRYNIEAKPAVPLDMFEPGSDTERQLRLMVQSLAAERFGLKLHHETKEMRLYFLTIGRKGNRLKRTAEAVGPGTSMHDGKGLLAATQIDMGMLARELGGVLGVPVIDKTSLNGAYDIRLEWTPDLDEPASVPGSSPSIFNAVQEQLGLKLESGRGAVETLVVEYARKASAN